jgi:hypothetical protein
MPEAFIRELPRHRWKDEKRKFRSKAVTKGELTIAVGRSMLNENK